jgi:hypothetical protein
MSSTATASGKNARAAGVGFDFSDGRSIKSDLEQVAPVTGGHDSVEADPLHHLSGFGDGIESCVRLKTGIDLPLFIHHHQFDGTGADVYAGKTHAASVFRHWPIRFLSK